MKKILFFLLIIFLSVLSFLAFHDKGNELIKPYISTYLESQFEQNTSIDIQHFKFDLNYVKFKVLLNNITKIEGEGELSLFSKTLNINYTIKSEGFKNRQINFQNQVDLNGTAKGVFSDIQIVGKGETLKSHLDYTLNLKNKADTFTLDGNIRSNLATLKLSNTTYNIQSKELLSHYVFNTPQLSKLMFLSTKKLNGRLQVTGKIQLKDKILQVMGSSNNLDGKIDFEYKNKKLNTYLKNINITKFLSMLGEKPYATGQLTGNIKLSDLKNLRGTFELKTKNAKTIKHMLKKELNINFEKAISFSLKSKGDIDSKLLNIQTTLNSDIFNYQSNDIKHTLKNSKLSSSYLLTIPKLSKLNAIVGKSLKGKLIIHGKINKNKDLLITGSTKSLGGNINFKLQKKKITSKINNVSVEKLMHLLSYPQIFKANIFGDFIYDLKNRKGQLNSKLDNSQLLSNKLTKLVKKIRGQDLTKERYNQTHFNAKLNKDIVDIDFKAKSKKVELTIPFGRINKITNNINATFNINIDNKDIKGKIRGNISKPKVTINSSKFIKDEIQNVLHGDIVDKQLKKLGLSTKETKKIKNLLGDLFK